MIERYLKLLESFKQQQLSVVMFAIRNKIIDTLQNKYFSEEAKTFFYDIEHCPLLLMSSPVTIENIPTTTNSAFVLTTDNKLLYFNINMPYLRPFSLNDEQLQLLKAELNLKETSLGDNEKFKCLFTNLSPSQIKTISTLTGHVHVEKAPFNNFSHQPKQIVQLKEIVNALYHAQLAFTDLENVDLRKGLLNPQFYKDLSTLYYSTIEHGYNASLLLTHLDIDIAGPFQKEIALLSKLFLAIKNYADGECGLIKMSVNPQTLNLEELKKITKHKTSYFLFNLQVFYINRSFQLTELQPTNLAEITALFPSKHDEPKEASQESLLKITSLTNHTPEGYKENAAEIAKVISEYPFSYNAGRYAGIGIDQMQPNTGQVDYHFLTSLGFILPDYIQQLTGYIHKASSDLTEFEPTLDKDKIEALRDDATKLLKVIDNLQNNSALLSLKVLNYIRIIRHIITMSTSIIEQMGHMSEKTQDLIRDKLATIKYEYLTELFALADKIEDEVLFAPGTLSQPLMRVVVPFYQQLIHYASKPVDFSVKGEELLTLEDPRFIEYRLQETQQRINTAQERLVKAALIKKAFNNFFSILEKPKYSHTPLIELQDQTKKILAQHYRYIQPFVEKYDIDLNNEIIHGLTDSVGYFDKMKNFYQWATFSKPTGGVANVLDYKQHLAALIDSEIASNELHIKLNTDIIVGVYNRADLSLRPVNPEKINFKFDEIKALKLNEKAALPLNVEDSRTASIITNHSLLTADQALTLYTFYEEKHSNLLRSKTAFAQFLSIVQEKSPVLVVDLDTETKETLRNLYLIFQPYFYNAFANDTGIKVLDRAIIASLKTPADTDKPKLLISEQHFLKAQTIFADSIQASLEFSMSKRDEYYKIAIQKYVVKTQEITLAPNFSYGGRNQHIIKHTDYSKALAEFRTILFKQTKYFSHPITSKLIPASSGLPFPELKNLDQALTENKQILCLKQIFNTLYHLEQICRQLESLNNKSLHSVYVYHLISTHNHLTEMHKLIKSLLDDPHLSLIAKELMMKFRLIQQTVVEQSDPYLVGSASITGVNLLQSDVVPTRDNLDTFPISLNNAYIRVESDLYYVDIPSKKILRITVDTENLINFDNEFFPKETSAEPSPKKTPEVLALTEEQLQKIASLTGHKPKQKTAKSVKLNAIWYPMQTLMLVPEHLHALFKQRALTDEELMAIQTNTKNIVLTIERLIKSSNSYFKLLLETPAMYALFKELRQKLGIFTTTANEAVMTHIKEIKSELFAQILLETDRWESILGLQSGLLSGDMKKILDEFYKGLVEPLGLVSQQHIDCVNNMDDFVTRISANNKRALHAELQQKALQSNCDKLSRLTTAIAKYNNFTSGFLPPASSWLKELAQQELIETYKDAYPSILEAQNAIGKEKFSAAQKASPAIDKVIHNSTDTSLPKITNISAAAKTATSYYQGLQSNFQLEQDTAKEKRDYLDNLYKEQTQANKKFIADYTNKTFANRVKTITDRQTDLLHLNSEYNEKLKQYLTDFQQEIVEISLPSKDIKKLIKKLLHEKNREFQEKYLLEYAQLDNVLASVTEFKAYFHQTHIKLEQKKTSLFEDINTLTKKNAQINSLELLARDKTLPAKERIEELRKQAGSAAFKIDILAYRNLDTLSFNWLKRCFLNLLTALHLYTPKHVKHYDRLADSVSLEPKLSHNRRKYGFFAEADRAYGIPKPFNFEPDAPTPGPAPAA